MPDVITHLARVQADIEQLQVRGVKPGQVQAEATHAVVPDLHRGEMAVAGRRDGAQPLHCGSRAFDLNAHRSRASRHPLILRPAACDYGVLVGNRPGRTEAAMTNEREGTQSGADRRSVLRSALVLGAAAPLAGRFSQARPAPAGGTRTVRRARASLSSQQLAGQRVIFSYPGLTVPSSLLAQIRAGEAAGVIFFG